MKLELVFPSPNRRKTYNSNMRRFTCWVNSKQVLTIDQDSTLNGVLDVEIGDKIFIDKRFAYRNKDASFYYIVGEPTAELINQQGKKKNVYTDANNSGVLFVLDDNDFKNAVNVAK